jgi:hypothetical protein
MPDLSAGDWYGCEGCGRSVCPACGRAAGRRCEECGGTRSFQPLAREFMGPVSAALHSESEAVGAETPAALLLIQRLLLERDGHPWHRMSAVQLLGPFVGEHPSPAEAILLDLFLHDSEEVGTRVYAAKALAPAVGRLQGRERLVPALRDEAALIRGWAYLLLGEHGQVHARELARDPSPAVRQLVARQDEVHSGG